MIEIGKKYKLKKLKGWFEKDCEEFTVLCFGEHNVVGCVAPDGERYTVSLFNLQLLYVRLLSLKMEVFEGEMCCFVSHYI